MYIFNQKINTKKYHCGLNGMGGSKVENDYINLYIQFKGCQATCKFCEWQNTQNVFNIEKYEKLLIHLVEHNILVNKFSFTGGEPTLNYKLFKDVLKLTKKYLPNSFAVVNTNGLMLVTMSEDGSAKEFDSIAISRHHYLDDKNNEIFGTDTPTKKVLNEVQQKTKNIHLSCNLIRGYIDNLEDVENYLEFADNVDIRDIGFVDLMPINNFAHDNKTELNINDVVNIFQTKEWTGIGCKCKNFLYISKNKNVIEIYNRKPTREKISENNNLVWNGENLINGFAGEIIF